MSDAPPMTTAPLSTLVPEMSVFQLPYIFRDYQHVYAALDGSDTLKKYYEGVLDKKGLKLVGFFAAGYRGIYGHFPVNSVADVKGKKVRVQEDKILVATFKALGMISTPIAFPEVATALQTKVIDYAEARRLRAIIVRRYPHSAGGRTLGQMPLNALFHAETNILLRAARENGGSLAGRTLEVFVDGKTCNNCERMLGHVARELGNPTVTFTNIRNGRVMGVVRDGRWRRP